MTFVKPPVGSFNTAEVIERYGYRMRGIWGEEYDLFKAIVCCLASRDQQIMAIREQAIIDAVKAKKKVCIYLPEKDLPKRSVLDVFHVGKLVRMINPGEYAYLVLSGGVTTTMGTNGEIEDRLALCGEMDARRMAEYFLNFDKNLKLNQTIFNWEGDGVFVENASKHAGHQAITLPPALFANKISLLVMTGPVEQISLRLTLKAAAGIDNFAKAWPNSEAVQTWRQNLRIITMPSYTTDGLGWDGMIGRHITAAEDAFAEQRKVSEDHTIGGETEKAYKEMFEPGRIVNPCQNMKLTDARKDSLFELELGHLI